MGKLIFAAVVFVVGVALYSALKRQTSALKHPTLLTGPMAVMAARLAWPAPSAFRCSSSSSRCSGSSPPGTWA